MIGRGGRSSGTEFKGTRTSSLTTVRFYRPSYLIQSKLQCHGHTLHPSFLIEEQQAPCGYAKLHHV